MSAEDDGPDFRACWEQWTTGDGPDDPHDTGIHHCFRNIGHHLYPELSTVHKCRCGATNDPA